jgi:hypothetical protein
MQSKQKEQLRGMCALLLPSEIVIRTGGCGNQEGHVCHELAEEVVVAGKQGETTSDLHHWLGQPEGTADVENLQRMTSSLGNRAKWPGSDGLKP